MVQFRKSSSSRSSKNLDAPMKDDTLPFESPFLFNAVDTDYPIVQESNEMTQQGTSDSFPQFSQREADRLRVQDNIVQNHLSQTLVADFGGFNNQHHVDTDGEVYEYRRHARRHLVRKREGNGEKEEIDEGARHTILPNSQSLVDNTKVTDKHEIRQRKDSKISQRTLKKLKESCGIKGKENEKDEDKGEKSKVSPNYLRGSENSYKEIDEDNIETDDEKDEKDPPWYKLSDFSLFRGGRTKKVDEPEVFPFFDPTASGNVAAEKVSEVRGNSKSPLGSDLNSGGVNGFREERGGFRNMGGFISRSKDPNTGMRDGRGMHGEDLQMSKNTSRKVVVVADSDPPFQTKIVYSSERGGEIIESEPATDKISVIKKIYKAPPEESRLKALASRHRRTGALPSMFKGGWSQRMNHAEPKKAENAKGFERDMEFDKAKSFEKAKERRDETSPLELTGDELILWHRQKALKELIGGSPRDDVEPILQNSMERGTKDLETQVYRMTSNVSYLHTCYVNRSNSVRSLRPIIENYPRKSRSLEMAHERVAGLQRTVQCPSPIPEEDEQDSSLSDQHQEQFHEPSSSNRGTDESSHSYKHVHPMAKAAVEDSYPFEVPGPFTNARFSRPRCNSIDEIVRSEERDLPALEHTTAETLPRRRQVKRFDTPISCTGKETDSESELIPEEHVNSETSTSGENKKLRRAAKANSLHQKFKKGFEKHEDFKMWEDKQIAKYQERIKDAFKRAIDKPEVCLEKYRDFRDWEDAWIDDKAGKFTGPEFPNMGKNFEGKRGEAATTSQECLLENDAVVKEWEQERARERAGEEEEEQEQNESEGTNYCDELREPGSFSNV